MNTNSSALTLTSRRRWLSAALGVALVFASAAGAERGRGEGSPGSAPATARVETADRFDWTDAAVGAGVATGLIVTAAAARGPNNWFELGDRKEHK